jgi:hypothetical protein
MFDPDTAKIKEICNSLIGCKIKIGFTIILPNGDVGERGSIKNCNIIGDCMEDILFPFLKKHIPTFRKGPKQKSPDFFNNGWEWESKCFNKTPGFDISNFNSYIQQIRENLKRKMYKTQYLIFKYNLKPDFIEIIDFKLCNVWEIINYTGKYPISLQCKKGMWYNIRPCSFTDMNNKNKTPEIFVAKICEAIEVSPNTLEKRERIIEDIYRQFHQLYISLNIASITGGVAILPNKSP